MGTPSPSSPSSDHDSGTYQRYRAPQQEGSTLVQPPFAALRELATARASDRGTPAGASSPIQLSGASLAQLQISAREHLIASASEWTQRYTDLPELPKEIDAPLIVSGHQPELFHPGVWFKNFALGTLAKQTEGIGVHLLIDSDLCRDVSIRVPHLAASSTEHDRLTLKSVPYDALSEPVPHEERIVGDAQLFGSFSNRVRDTISSHAVNHSLLLDQRWPLAVEAEQQGLRLGEALSAARHRIERLHGNPTLELPISRVCDSVPFQHFAAELLFRAEEVAKAYNVALARYRQAHRIRTAAQPLPDLGQTERAFEAPFWVWSNVDPTRRALWVDPNGPGIRLSDRTGWETRLEAQTPADLVDELATLRDAGIKIRSRALATTLYARLVLADLFLHGIGGAKYDQVTDEWAEQLFGTAPPSHGTLTATLRLFPSKEGSSAQAERQLLTERLRGFAYHPEQWIDSDRAGVPPWSEAIAEKQRWIATPKTNQNGAERHQAISRANGLLREALEDDRRSLEAKLVLLDQREQQERLRLSREYSFVLFEEESLVGRLQQLATEGTI